MNKYLIVVILCILLTPTSIYAQERVPMTLEKSGIYTIPCEVNGLKLRFVFDTGAADVHISLIEAAFMYKNGYITDDDFIGAGKYSMADGFVAENAIVNLKKIKIGSKTITNVTACVSSNIDASLLLGQSAIKKLGNYSIEGSTLVLNGSTTSSQYSSSTSVTSASSSNGYVDNSYNSTHNRNYSYDDDDDDEEYTYNRKTTSGYTSSQSNTYEDVDYYLAQVTTDLNLREGPGTYYDVVSRIPHGDYVFLSTADAGQSFRKVLYVDKNIFGYVSKNYLTNFRKVEEDTSGNLQVESRNYKKTADIQIENRSNKTATIAIGSLTYTFSPYQTRTIKDIKPGKYKTMASSPGVIPYVGFDTVEGGYEYSWVFFIKTVTK